MSLKSTIKRIASFLLHGNPRPVYANVRTLQPHGRLKDKHIIITGGGHGLGLAMAKRFIAEGAKVLIAGRNEERLRASATEIGCCYLPLDVTEVASFPTFITKADGILGGIDCLVNNAGISLHEPSFFDVTESTFDRQTATNLKGAFFLTQHFVHRLKEQRKGGGVLFISSNTGEMADIRPYGLTKAAMNSLTKGLARLLATDGIRVNAIAPGVTASEMTGFSADGNLRYDDSALGRVYLPEEMAEVACFILSDESGCISGQIIVCDNGSSINSRLK